MEWNGVVKVRYESMVMVRRALVGELNILCKHAFLAGPCTGIRGIRGTLDKQVKSKERQRWERFRANTSSVWEFRVNTSSVWKFNASSGDWKRRCFLTRE